MLRGRSILALPLLAFALVWAGCDTSTVPADDAAPGHSADASAMAPPTPGQVVAFSLVDKSEASATFGQQVAPAAHLGSVTGWYFTHAS